MKRFILCCLAIFGLCSCTYQEPQMLIIDSNITAFVYQGNTRLGSTPFAGKIKRENISDITLKKRGYQTIKLPAERVFSRSFDSSTGKFFNVLTDSQNLPDGLTRVSTLLPSFPLFLVSDGFGLAFGYWIEYIPNTYYVEMIPDNKGQKISHTDLLKQFQIKSFALQAYPSLSMQNAEHLAAMEVVSGISKNNLLNLLSQHTDAVSFAEAVSRN